MDVKLATDDGRELDASVEVVEAEAAHTMVILQSAGGVGRGGRRRNPDYDDALRLLVARALEAGWELADVRLASRRAMAQAPMREQRSVDIGGYPVRAGDPRHADLRLVIGRRVERMFQKEGVTRGGNRQKRLELDFLPPQADRRLVTDLAPPGPGRRTASVIDRYEIEVRGQLLDLDVLYTRMWEAAEPDPGRPTRTYIPSTSAGRPAMKRLLAELFGVPVSDPRDPVNDACRRAVSMALSQRGWAQKVDAKGQVCEPIHRTPNYRLYPRTVVATRPTRPRQPEYKVFRADPGHYDIDRAIVEFETDWWSTAGRRVGAGDMVAIYRLQGTGAQNTERSVVAFAEVLTDPEQRTDEVNPFWKNPNGGRRLEDRVRVRYIDAPRLPLLEGENSTVAALSTNRARGGTVFDISASEWQQLTEAAGLSTVIDHEGDSPPGLYENPPEPTQQPPPVGTERPRIAPPGTLAGSDTDRQELGSAGEDWVVAQERRRLIAAGREDLAKRVNRVSQTVGDGLGYDVASFETDGRERHIEVKTTRAGRRAPFEFTSNELAVSRTDDAFVLYRVYNFSAETRCWTRPGPLDSMWFTTPSVYRAHPASLRLFVVGDPNPVT